MKPYSGNGDGMQEGAPGSSAAAEARFRRILEERAAQFATPPAADEAGERLNLVIVQIGAERYGIESRYVFRIRPEGQITCVPRVPGWIAGVANERGRVLSVFDLQRFLNLPAPENGGERTHYLAVVETPEMELALRVDEVQDVVAIPLNALRAGDDTVRGLPGEYVRGVTAYADEVGEHTVVVMDLRALLADERLILHEEIV